MLSIFDSIPEAKKALLTELANAISETLSRYPFSKETTAVNLGRLLEIMHFTEKPENRSMIITNIIDNIDLAEGEQKGTFILSTLVHNKAFLNSTHKGYLNSKLSTFGSQIQSLRRFAEGLLGDNFDLAQEILPQSFYYHNIELLQNPGAEADTTVDFMKPFFTLVDDEGSDKFADIVDKHLSSLPQDLTPSNRLGLECMASVAPKFIPANRRESLVRRLDSCYRNLSNANQKNDVTRAYINLIPALSEQDQAVYDSSLLETIDRSDANFLIEIIDIVEKNSSKMNNVDEMLRRIGVRVRNLFTNKEVRLAYYNLAHAIKKPELIRKLIVETYTQTNITFDALDEAESFITPNEFRQIVHDLIDVYDNLPVSQIESAFENLGSYTRKFTKDFLKTITEKLINDWFQKPTLQQRNAAKKFWEGIRKKSVHTRQLMYDRLLAGCRRSKDVTAKGRKIYRKKQLMALPMI